MRSIFQSSMTEFASSFSHSSRTSRSAALAVAAVDLDLEELALPHVGDRTVAERRAGALDRSALRVEHVGLQGHADDRLHEATPSVRAKIASTLRSEASRSKACSISSLESTRAISASPRMRSRKFPPFSQVSIA